MVALGIRDQVLVRNSEKLEGDALFTLLCFGFCAGSIQIATGHLAGVGTLGFNAG